MNANESNQSMAPYHRIVPRPTCGSCGAIDVRIYRSYGSFRRPETDRCNECVDPNSRGWFVPCVMDEDGTVWGYSSVPLESCEAFYDLPEKSADHPGWNRVGGWPDSDD